MFRCSECGYVFGPGVRMGDSSRNLCPVCVGDQSQKFVRYDPSRRLLVDGKHIKKSDSEVCYCTSETFDLDIARSKDSLAKIDRVVAIANTMAAERRQNATKGSR